MNRQDRSSPFSPNLRTVLLCGAALGCLPLGARANPPPLPSGGHFIAGSGRFSRSANALRIDQTTSRGIIDWRDFSIGRGDKVSIANGTGATLNRVTGGEQSTILGGLTSSGSLYLINPAGVVIGAGGKVVTGGDFVASSRDITNPQFLAGGTLTASGASSGSVLNQGSITSTAGNVALIGNDAGNTGSIMAPNGTAALVAGNQVILDPGARDGNIAIAVSGGGNVSQNGRIAAAAAALDAAQGNVYAVAGNNGGIVAATGTTVRNGQIWLSAGSTATIGGTLAATGQGSPAITVKAATIAITASALIAARGAAHGGHITIMSSRQTKFAGRIDASPTNAKSPGGQVEVSSAGQLGYAGRVILNAPGGTGGQLLLDPENLTIVATGATTATPDAGGFIATKDSSVLTVASLQGALAAGNVTLQTATTGTQSGDITVAANVAWSGGGTLTLDAYRNIAIDPGASITNTGSGSLVLRADTTGKGAGAVALSGRIDFAGSTGHVSIFYDPAGGYAAPVNYDGAITTNPSVSQQATAFMLVNSLANLESLSANLTGTYALGRAIDASASATTPFTTIAPGFAGTLNGQGLAITNLTIAGLGKVGLFSTLASPAVVYDLILTGAKITNHAAGDTGIIAADNAGTIAGVAVSGTVSGTGGGTPSNIGGIAGTNSGVIEQSSAVGSVALTGLGNLGGLVGAQTGGTIAQTFTGNNVTWNGAGTALGGVVLGGLAGSVSGGVLEDSYSLGTVSAQASNNGHGIALGGVAGSLAGGVLARDLAIGRVIDTTGDHAVELGADTGQIIGSAATESAIYWDAATTGLTTDGNGGRGAALIAASLASALPGGFAPGVWQLPAGGLFPYLAWQSPTAPDVVSGSLGSAAIGGAGLPGQSVTALLNGKTLNSLLSAGPATTFADGSYEFLLPAGAIATGKNLIVAADGGQTLQAGTTGSVAGLKIAADTVWLNSASTSVKNIFGQYVSGLGGAPAAAVIGAAGVTPVNATNTIIFAGSGASLTFDQPVANVPYLTLALSNPTAIGQSIPLVITNLLVEGGTVNLNNAGNAIANVAGQTGALALATTGSIAIAPIGGVNGLDAAAFLNIAAVHNIIAAAAPIAVSGTGAQATLYADSHATDNGYVLLPAGFNIPHGTLTVFEHPPGYPNPSGIGNNVVGKLIDYELIDSPTDLNQIGIAPNASYALNTNLTLKGNFTPIQRFSGVLNGFGYTINNLSITNGTGGNFGMFIDNAGTIENLNLANVSILNTATSPGGGVPIGGFGPLAGINDTNGIINNVTVSGAVTSTVASQGRGIGGIVGYNDGSITNTLSAVAVTASGSYESGFAGGNSGTISLSGETGQVLSTSADTTVGGLVASNFGAISQSYATGAISAGSGSNIGGLVAVNYGTIRQSFAIGSVKGGTGAGNTGSLNGESVGGLVGWNYSGLVGDSYATGAVSGGSTIGSAITYVGGVIGLQDSTATNIYAAGPVSGGTGADVGALSGAGAATNEFFDPALSRTSKSSGKFPGSTTTFTVSPITGTARFGGFTPAIWTFPRTPGALPYLAFQTGLFPAVAVPPPIKPPVTPPAKPPTTPPTTPPVNPPVAPIPSKTPAPPAPAATTPPASSKPPAKPGATPAVAPPPNAAATAAAAIIAKANALAAQLIQVGLTTRTQPATVAPATAGKATPAPKPLNLSGFDATNSVMVDVAMIGNDPTNTMIPNPATMMTTTISYQALGLDGAPINVSNQVMNNGIPTGTLAQAAQSDSSSGTSLANLFGQGGLTPTGLAPGSIIFATGVSSAGASFAGMPGQGGLTAGSMAPGSIVGGNGASSAGAGSIDPTTVTAPAPGTKPGKGTGSTSAAPYSDSMGVAGYDTGVTSTGPYNATAPAVSGGGNADPLSYGSSGLTPDVIAGTPLSNGQDIIPQGSLADAAPAGNPFSTSFNPPAPATPATPSVTTTIEGAVAAAAAAATNNLAINDPNTPLTGSTLNTTPTGALSTADPSSLATAAATSNTGLIDTAATNPTAGPASQYDNPSGALPTFAGPQDYQMLGSYTASVPAAANSAPKTPTSSSGSGTTLTPIGTTTTTPKSTSPKTTATPVKPTATLVVPVSITKPPISAPATPTITETGAKTATKLPTLTAKPTTATSTATKISVTPPASPPAATLQPTALKPVVIAGSVSQVHPSGTTGQPFVIGITAATAP